MKSAGEYTHAQAQPTVAKVSNHSIGRRIQQRRMELGFSQEELGERLGVSYQQVQKYENGKSELTVTRLQDMAIHLRISMEFFFKGATPNKNTKVAISRQSVRERQLVKLYRAINDGSVQSALFQLTKRLGQKMRRAAGASPVPR